MEDKRRKYLIAGCIVTIVILLIILVILIISDNKKSIKRETPHLVFTEELQIPNGPEVQKNYNISREPKESWTEDDTSDWFTIPTATDIEALSNSNENMVLEIIGAAP